MVARGGWSGYEKGRVVEYEGLLKEASAIVWRMKPPWSNEKHRKGGRPFEHDARALILCLLLKVWLKRSYRDLVSFLNGSRHLWSTIGLKELPGRMALQRGMRRLDRAWLDSLNRRVVEMYDAHKKGLEEG